jgi:hypothetical protein
MLNDNGLRKKPVDLPRPGPVRNTGFLYGKTLQKIA